MVSMLEKVAVASEELSEETKNRISEDGDLGIATSNPAPENDLFNMYQKFYRKPKNAMVREGQSFLRKFKRDSTGPHGRGAGPGQGQADGSGHFYQAD